MQKGGLRGSDEEENLTQRRNYSNWYRASQDKVNSVTAEQSQMTRTVTVSLRRCCHEVCVDLCDSLSLKMSEYDVSRSPHTPRSAPRNMQR